MSDAFNRIISIDWSGAGSEDERVDLRVAVWDDLNDCRIQLPKERSKTRSWKRTELRAWLAKMLSEDGRTLVAMDFGFSLPWGSDKSVFKVAGWRAMVQKISEFYGEAGTARAAAQAINSQMHLNGHGPYRFDESRTDYRFYLDHGVAYYRYTEMFAPQAISQWYLGSGGTVGFHTITGLSALDSLLRLREQGKLRFAVWPFEAVENGGHFLVESYPAICPKCTDDQTCQGDHERDAWKVLKHLVSANEHGWLTRWLTVPDLPCGRITGVSLAEQVRFEGAIIGMCRATPFMPDPHVTAEHHQWLSGFDLRHLTKWNALLEADAEAAMCEATFRRVLERAGCNVEPNETFDGSEQRPDFKCIKDGQHFYVEVTCISISKAIEETGLPGSEEEIMGTIVTGHEQGLTDAIWGASKGKAKQVSMLDAPSIVAVGTFHGRASEVCLTDSDVAMSLTGHWQMFLDADQNSGVLADKPLVTTSLESSAFLRRDSNNLATPTRCSISGILMAGFGTSSINVKGVLHPDAARPFDRGLLPSIPFCQLKSGNDLTQLATEWV